MESDEPPIEAPRYLTFCIPGRHDSTVLPALPIGFAVIFGFLLNSVHVHPTAEGLVPTASGAFGALPRTRLRLIARRGNANPHVEP